MGQTGSGLNLSFGKGQNRTDWVDVANTFVFFFKLQINALKMILQK